MSVAPAGEVSHPPHMNESGVNPRQPAACVTAAATDPLARPVVFPPPQEKWTALHVAAENGHIEVVKALLAAGADKNATNYVGC